MGTRWRTRNLVAILALALLAACSCSSSDDDDPTPAPTTSSSTTTTPEEEVKAAYLAYRQMVTRLLESPDADDPEISEHTTGENRDFLTSRLATLEASGQALRFSPEHSYSVVDVSVTGDKSVVHDCTVDAAQTVTVESGQVVSEGTATELLEATLTFDSGWKVETIDSLQQWQGVSSCAE